MTPIVEYPAFLSDGDVPTWIERHLPDAPLTPEGEALPPSIRRLVRLGVYLARPARIELYGSRARGDAAGSSDYDLALFGIEDATGFARLIHDAEYEFITLHTADLLDGDKAPEPLRTAIAREGVTLYERT